MRQILIMIFLISLVFSSSAQSYNSEKVEFTNYIKRMYQNEQFEGVRIVTDYDSTYMIVVIRIDNSSAPESSLSRVASVKAMNEANRYINGSLIKSEFIYEMKQVKKGKKVEMQENIIDNIHENSMGYVKSLELLSSFEEETKKIYIFGRKLAM